MKRLERLCGTRRRSVGFLIFSLLSLGIMITIFCFSAQNGTDSKTASEGFFAVVEEWVANLFGGSLPAVVSVILTVLHEMLRKLAHLLVYFALGCTLSGAFLCLLRPNRRWKKGVLAFCLAVAYAATDELHQLFVPGRSGELRDVLIDSVGILAGVLLMQGIWRWVDRRQNRKLDRKR